MTVCGCMGCHNDAAVVIEHPEYGRRTVCRDHTDGAQTILGEVSAS